MKLLPTLTLILLAAALPAQLSGSYTLDPQGSGARNFQSFAEAVFVLVTQGVSAAVVIDVKPGNYPETVEVFPIPGASSTRTVTIRSPQPGAAKLVPNSYGDLLLATRTIGSTRTRWVTIEGLALDKGSGPGGHRSFPR